MKPSLYSTAALGIAGLAASTAAFGHVDVNVNVGTPAPVYVAPAPVRVVTPPTHVVVEKTTTVAIGWHGDRYWDGHRYWSRSEWALHH